jgi:lipopolysaccharide/colanic/teichoic acid biosynthesis glycosyltransferase
MDDKAKPGVRRRAANVAVRVLERTALKPLVLSRAEEAADARPKATHPPVGGWPKRLIDICGASAALLLAGPLMLICILAIKLTSRGKALFAHQRLGFNGETFPCLKFRSMYPDAAERLEIILATDPAARAEWDENQKLARDPRVTPVGHFLRRTSLDELPQFINVLLGHMSLVGPRPIVRAEAPRYGANYADYTKARPGITGLWQVSGRSDTGYGERVQLDTAYVNEWTLAKDVKILFQTVNVVLRQKGAL